MSGALTATAIVGTIGMNILGSVQQSQAQQAAGEQAYQAALQRNQELQYEAKARQQQLEIEAKQRQDAANVEQATAQRKAIEAKRRGNITAGRAQAVMAASGGGVDNSIIAGILGEGDYAKDVALYEGDNAAQKLRYQADLNQYEGAEGVRRAKYEGDSVLAQGQYTKSVMGWRAGNTLAMGIGKALFSGLSLAGKYGGDSPGTGSGNYTSTGIDEAGFAMTDWSKYGANGQRLD